MQYIQTAMDLVKTSTSLCLKMPKRYTFFIATDLVKTAQDIYKDVVYLKTLHNDKELQSKVCDRCVARLEYLASMLNIAYLYAENKITDKQWDCWVGLITKEIALIKGIKKSLGSH